MSTHVHTFNPSELRERALYRRAVEAAIWGMPVVNYHVMFQEWLARPVVTSTRRSTDRDCWIGRIKRSRQIQT
jgi:hypothetical protein